MHVSAATLDRIEKPATFEPNYIGHTFGHTDTDIACTYCAMGDWHAPAVYVSTVTYSWGGNDYSTETVNLCNSHLAAWGENLRDTGI
jgi:hypothetical protein